MQKTILILCVAMLLAFICGVVYGYIAQLLDRIQGLRERCKELNRQNAKLRQQRVSQFDRACSLNVALGETRQDVERLQEQSKAQQNQLAVKDKLLQARKETSYESRNC